MPTGDITNNLRKLQKELKQVKFAENINLTGMSQGSPAAFLPVYHYIFTSYSHAIAEMISTTDAELYGKTDFRFLEAVYKILRDLFNYKPPITKEQFFNNGFAERKIIMCFEVIQMVREKNRSLQPQKRSTTVGTAVSGISQLNHGKTYRAKSAEHSAPLKNTTTAVTTKSTPSQLRKSSDDQLCAKTEGKHVKIATPPQVVNELLQPYRESDMTRHMPIHSDDNDTPTSQKISSPPRVMKEVLSPDQSTGDYSPRFQGFKWAVITPSISKVKSAAVEVVSVPRGLNLQADESDTAEPVEVNAITRGDSFLGQSEPGIEVFQSDITNLHQSIHAVDCKMQGFESAIKHLTSTVQAQQQVSGGIETVLGSINQKLETLMARMVLVENRVAMVEAKVGDVYRPAQSSGTGDNQIGNVYKPSHSNGTGNSHLVTKLTSPMAVENTLSSHPTKANQNTSKGTMDERQQPHGDNGVLVSALVQNKGIQGDTTSFALSPIRKPPDMSMNSTGLPFDFTSEETFAMTNQDDDNARRSSTPAQHIDHEISQSSAQQSFRFEDSVMQHKIDHIKHMFKTTEGMLKN